MQLYSEVSRLLQEDAGISGAAPIKKMRRKKLGTGGLQEGLDWTKYSWGEGENIPQFSAQSRELDLYPQSFLESPRTDFDSHSEPRPSHMLLCNGGGEVRQMCPFTWIQSPAITETSALYKNCDSLLDWLNYPLRHSPLLSPRFPASRGLWTEAILRGGVTQKSLCSWPRRLL